MTRGLGYFSTLGLLVVAAGCGSKGAEAKKAQEDGPAQSVRTAAVERVEWPAVYEATGTVRARSIAQVSSRVMAYVREVRVRVGDHVNSGQTLVVLDSRDSETRRQQAEAGRNEAHAAASEAEYAISSARANLELAETTFKRMKDLYDKRSISDQEFDEASTRVKLAKANLDMAQSRKHQVAAKIAQADQEVKGAEIMTGYSAVIAPFAGVVTEKNVEPGNLATPGAPLMTVEQGGSYRLEASVEESNLSKVRMGQVVPVQLDGVGEMQGRVGEIVPAVDPTARTFITKIDLPASPLLRTGQFGRARFAFGQRSSVAVPSGAIRERGQVQWVYAVQDGRARTRMVTVGDRRDQSAEVLSGLSEGERIVYPVPDNMRDGVRVEVKE